MSILNELDIVGKLYDDENNNVHVKTWLHDLLNDFLRYMLYCFLLFQFSVWPWCVLEDTPGHQSEVTTGQQ